MAVSLGERARRPRRRAIRGRREQIRVRFQIATQRRAALSAAFAMSGEHVECLRIECDASSLARLGPLLAHAGLWMCVASFDAQEAANQIEVTPAKRAYFAAAGAGDHSQPQEQAPFRVT